MNAKELATECVAAADEFIERRPWQRFDNEDLLAFDLPARELLIGSIMGAAGEEHGLVMLQGPRAFDDFCTMLEGAERCFDTWTSTLISVSLTPTVEIEPPFDRILKQAGRTGRTAPMFFVKEADLNPRPPREAELETILFALRGLLVADATGRLMPDAWREPRVLPLLRITGNPRDPGVKVLRSAIAQGGEQEPPEFEVPSDLGNLPRLDTVYCVGLPTMPTSIQGERRETRALAVLDAETGTVKLLDIILGLDLQTAAESLFAGLRGEGRFASPGMPQRMVFANEPLYRALHRGFGALGVVCSYEASVPPLDDMLDGLDQWMNDTGGPAPDDMPDSEDLQGWKAVDLRVTERLAELAFDSAFQSNRAWKRYFGRARDETQLDSDEQTAVMLAAYVQWFVVEYRATKRSKTVAVRALDSGLPPAERAALEARIAERPSLYQVRGMEPGESIDVIDLLSGRELRVTDKSLSLSAVRGMAFFAYVYPVGAFYFAAPASPPLAATDVERALAFLEAEHGFTPGNSIDPAGTHFLGRLWAWTKQHTGFDRLQLVNTEGQALRGQVARFEVENPASLAESFDRRDDVDTVDPGAEWTWHRKELHLGSLTLFGNELLLEVNSRERFQAARAWLEAITGVTFAGVEEKNLDPRALDPRALDDTPLDDRLPSKQTELAPGTLAEVQRLIDAKCFEWLDEPIPALGHKTPRQACKTAEGRNKVARMIRTYPDPGGIPGLTVPRAEMLAGLGLEERTAAE